jgi:uncharacterized SAM-binding protein YcdF (DUF218 family)
LRKLKIVWLALLTLAAASLALVGIGALAFGLRSGVMPLFAGAALSVLLCARFPVRRYLPRVYTVASRLISALCACVLVVSVIASAQILSCYFDDDAPPGSAMIVLGCGLSPQNHTSPSLMLTLRLNAAERYLREHGDTVCVVSGGQGPDELVSEAQSMYDYLVSRGIDGARLLRESASRSTRENLAYSMETLEAAGIQAENVIIVTDGFHEYRAHHIARGLGIDAYTVSSQAPFGLTAYFWLREIAGVVLQTWFRA